MSMTHRRLKKVYQNAKVIPFDSSSKFIIMSDCHRGIGNIGDNFSPNQNMFYGALEYYYNRGFSYIELGDGDELWENKKLKSIIEIHPDAFSLLHKFYKKNKLNMIFGNHDIVKSKRSYLDKHCRKYHNDFKGCVSPLFENMEVHEGIILYNKDINSRIFLVHGHQGDLLNDVLWPVARFLVRYIWSPLELIGFKAPISAGVSHQKRDKIEKKLSDFANYINNILIAGHTHRPVFSEPGLGLYFNDGACIHPRCMTGIEIENNKISLVKWSVCTRKDRTLYICRKVIKGPRCLFEYKN